MYEDWTFHHIGLVVKDVDKTLEYYQAMDLNAEKSSMTIMDMYKIAYGSKSDLSFEFLQPIDSNSRQMEFLTDHGEGIDHMCYIVSDLEKEKTKLVKLGVPVVENIVSDEDKSLFETMLFDTRQGGTIMLELRQFRDPENVPALKEIKAEWEFDHLAFVVNDIYKSLNFYVSLGFEAQFRARVPKGVPLAVFCRKGPVTLMFHGHNDWAQGKKFFEAHGEGIDHIAFNVENVFKEADVVSKKGFPLLGKIGASPDASRAFFDTRQYGGLLLELAQVKMSLWW